MLSTMKKYKLSPFQYPILCAMLQSYMRDQGMTEMEIPGCFFTSIPKADLLATHAFFGQLLSNQRTRFLESKVTINQMNWGREENFYIAQTTIDQLITNLVAGKEIL